MKLKINKILIIFIAVGVLFMICCRCNSMAQNEIEHLYNPKLKFVQGDFEGNIVVDGIFCNGVKKDKAPLIDVIKWKLSVNPQKEEKRRDTFKLSIMKDYTFQTNQDNVIIWLGHSSFFVRLSGYTYLIDPILSDLPTSKRKVINPYRISDLGKIDYVLISHAHFDHFDIPTLKTVSRLNPHVEILGPLGLKKLLKEKEFKNLKIQEAAWFQLFDTDQNEITFLPAKHWYRRGLFDFNKVLWGSFGIKTKNIKLFFAGDTAKDISFFEQIKDVYNDFDICILPIGAYSPQFLMKEEHVNPKEAIELFNILNGNYFIPMHYGTYDLSDEPLGEPIRQLRKYAKENSIEDKIVELSVGQILYIDTMINKKL